MNVRKGSIVILVVAMVAGSGAVHAQTPAGMAFAYQGQLLDDGVPVNDTCNFEFTCYDAVSGVGQIGPTVTSNGVPVTNGLFTVTVDFGADRFTGDARWLEVAVRCSGDGGFTTLSPRQELTPTPYALALPGLWTEQNATSPNLIGGHRSNSVAVDLSGVTIAGGGDGEVGGLNEVAGAGQFATIGGGRANYVSAFSGTVSGGNANRAEGLSSTVGGGEENFAAAYLATIGGGRTNRATAFAFGATVGGGYENDVAGEYATIPGGYQNDAAGNYSFAAGRRAQANHAGAFVWADTTDASFTSTATDQFLVRASGGVGINTNGPLAALHIGGTPGSDGIMFPDGTLQTTAASGGNGWSLSGNSGTTPGTDFLGTTDDAALELHVNSARALRIEPHAASPNLIGGYSGNSTTNGVYGATIGGGGQSGQPNRATYSYATVSGGYDNVASYLGAAVGGGIHNEASGSKATVGGGFRNAATDNNAAVGGGIYNIASGNNATISGGWDNDATATSAAVGGGSYNVASNGWSTVPGGWKNTAGGEFSFAAGQRAKVRGPLATGDGDGDEGTFVWADSTAADFVSTGPNQFLIRSAGGVGINTNGPQATLHVEGDIAVEGWIGTVDDEALELHVNGERALRIEPDATSPNLIGGYSGNSTTNGVYGATIAGGGGPEGLYGPYPNRVIAPFGTVSGGSGNEAGWYGTVAGGAFNVATNNGATVGGGGFNDASGYRATVPGGSVNTAGGDYSFAAGRRANANHDGAFVWADSTDAGFASTSNDQFLIRASGGVGIGTNDPQAMLHVGGTAGVDGIMFPDGTLQTTAAGIHSATVTVDPPSLASAASTTMTVTVSGAQVGDAVVANPGANLPNGYGITFVRVSAASTITIGFINGSASPQNPPASSWQIRIFE